MVLGSGLGNCNCLSRTRLLFHKERGLTKRRENTRSWASGREASCTIEEGTHRVLEGAQRGVGTGGAAEVVEAGVH